MKTVFQRVFGAMYRGRHRDPDIEAAAPLMHLLDEAEPSPDMFARIEARIDAEQRRFAWPRRGVVALAFLCGLLMGGLVVFVGQDSQKIVARAAADAPWVPLGAVTLHGSGLRGFVRAKCHGHTHFLITMHGHTHPEHGSGPPAVIPLMEPQEKILMECIF